MIFFLNRNFHIKKKIDNWNAGPFLWWAVIVTKTTCAAVSIVNDANIVLKRMRVHSGLYAIVNDANIVLHQLNDSAPH